MNDRSVSKSIPRRLAALGLVSLAACSGGGGDGGGATPPPSATGRYALGSVVIDADGNRTTYVQTVASLDDGPFDNESAVELPGNGVVMALGRDVFVGLAEAPTWVRYTANDAGTLVETGRLSLLNFGTSYVDYGNAIVDDTTAVSVLSGPDVAVVWNPSTMQIVGEVPLGHPAREGYSLEVWTTVAHDGLVYIPGRWADWEGGRIYAGVSLTILDPKNLRVVAVAEDDRCASGGRVVFDEQGYGYVMGDGRTYSSHMFANARGETAAPNCLLRIPPGGTDFEDGYFHTIQSLTGGLESISELETAGQSSGLGFAKMFYPDQLPEGVEPVDFGFWSVPAHKMWRIDLADPPRAEVVADIPFSTIGFTGSALDGSLFVGESADGAVTEVYEIDAEVNRAAPRFVMDGYFYGLFELSD